jgi:RNA polymerase sigma-70 factor (ECF subfamily)
MVRLLPRLRRFAYSLTRNADQGDDLAQETCVRALSRIDQWQPGTSLDSWMFRIAQNLWLDQLRAAKTRGTAIDLDAAGEISGSDGRDVTDSRLTMRDVAAGMSALAPEQQVLVALVCIDGHSYKEAAEVLDLPIGTVMSRLARARRTLHDVIEGKIVKGSHNLSGVRNVRLV